MEELSGDSKDVVEYAMAIFKDRKITELWFSTPLGALKGACPKDLLAASEGRETIMVILRKIEFGDLIA